MITPLIKQKIVSSITSHVPLSILSKLTRTDLIIPYYQLISDDHSPHTKHLYEHKNIKQFKDDLAFLLKNYSPVSLLDIMDFIKTGRSLPYKAFLLTFDDGLRECHDMIAPILHKKGIPSTFFINTAFIDNRRLCHQHKASIIVENLQINESLSLKKKVEETLLKNKLGFNDIKSAILSITYQQKNLLNEIASLINLDFNDYLLRYKPYLTSDQIKILIKDGFTIGAHSIDHPLYSLLLLEEQLYQTIESVKLIKDKFCLDYGAFAFPHSDNGVSKIFFEELSSSGLVNVSFGTGGILSDSIPNNFQRFSLEKPLIPPNKIIAFQYARKLSKLLTGNGKKIRK
jgi:peptidoglycan/xylan/chitin deacetylase (PgdA/CDA1 family)